MRKRVIWQIMGRWFAAWSSRADVFAAAWQERQRRWARRSEKFFLKLNGGQDR